ncbi:T-complex protein 1 subunit alpha-like [Hordeum vulgare]|nr:T-complex protein 1 subunit alpha-like [Hordeum vulgare]
MLVDDIGDVTITNDGATILRMLEVEHPAAKILVELAKLQDRKVGDGTTSVVIIAAELLKSANELVRNKIHPTSIISGYRLSMRESCKYVEEKLSVKVDKLGKDSLVNCAKTSMSSKLIHSDRDFFANLPAGTPDSYDCRLGDCRTLDYATLGDLVFSRIYRSASQIGWSKDKCLERNKLQKIWDGLSVVEDKYIYKVNRT